MTDKIQATNPYSEEAWQKEGNWLSIAIAMAIVFPVAGAFSMIWVLELNDTREILRRVQILAPVGVLAVAATTFATVIWRGLISARQADIGLQQISGLQRQLALTEENNLANLLQTGAELIVDNSPARVAAGITTLGAIAKSDPEPFGNSARELLLEYVGSRGSDSHRGANVIRAIDRLAAAYRVRPDRIVDAIYFEEDDDLSAQYDDYFTDWKIVYGAKETVYGYGRFNNTLFPDNMPSGFKFSNVSFYECHFSDIRKLEIFKCKFYECTFDVISARHLAENSFRKCEFTGAKIIMNEAVRDLRPDRNWFMPEMPPTFVDNPGPHLDPEEKFLSHYPADVGDLEFT